MTASRDVALSTLKAALSTIPVLGGPIASLLGDALQAHTDRALRRALQLLTARLDQLSERVDLGSIDQDELAELFKSCYLTIVRTHHEEKLRAATALIANLMLRSNDPDKLPYSELDHFARCIDAFSIGAIQVLGHAFAMASKQGRDVDTGYFRFNFADLRHLTPDTSPDLLMGLVGELNSMNLVYFAGGPGIPSAEKYANNSIELTPLGARFVKRLMLPALP